MQQKKVTLNGAEIGHVCSLAEQRTAVTTVVRKFVNLPGSHHLITHLTDMSIRDLEQNRGLYEMDEDFALQSMHLINFLTDVREAFLNPKSILDAQANLSK